MYRRLWLEISRKNAVWETLTQMGVQGQNKNLKEIGYKNIEVA
jgi:hypothetical protein